MFYFWQYFACHCDGVSKSTFSPPESIRNLLAVHSLLLIDRMLTVMLFYDDSATGCRDTLRFHYRPRICAQRRALLSSMSGISGRYHTVVDVRDIREISHCGRCPGYQGDITLRYENWRSLLSMDFAYYVLVNLLSHEAKCYIVKLYIFVNVIQKISGTVF